MSSSEHPNQPATAQRPRTPAFSVSEDADADATPRASALRPTTAPLQTDLEDLQDLQDLQALAVAAAQPLPESPLQPEPLVPIHSGLSAQPAAFRRAKSPLRKVSVSSLLDATAPCDVSSVSSVQSFPHQSPEPHRRQPSGHMPSKSPLMMASKSPGSVAPLDFQPIPLNQPLPFSQQQPLPDWLGTPPPANVIYFPPLPAPNRPITPHPPTAHPLAYSVMQDQGSGSYMQDRFLMTDSLFGVKYTYLFAVCDGHGEHGDTVSQFVCDHLLSILSNYADEFAADPVSALVRAFAELDDVLLTRHEQEVYGSGSCIVVAIITPERLLVTANLGDSRVVLGKLVNRKTAYVPFKVPKLPKTVNGLAGRRLTGDESAAETTDDEDSRPKDFEALPLTSDHTLSDDDEKERCIAAGGRVERLPGEEGAGHLHPLRLYKGSLPYPGIMVTRSFGDSMAKKLGVTAHPEVRCQQIDDRDLCLILGSDGLFDGLSNERVVKTCFNVWKAWRKRRPDSQEWMTDLRGLRKVAHESAKRMLRKSWKEDNVTAMCVML